MIKNSTVKVGDCIRVCLSGSIDYLDEESEHKTIFPPYIDSHIWRIKSIYSDGTLFCHMVGNTRKTFDFVDSWIRVRT